MKVKNNFSKLLFILLFTSFGESIALSFDESFYNKTDEVNRLIEEGKTV